MWTAILPLALASTAFAQGTLTGTVRDASGGVLPGVTVEASSPALIEKVRTAITDGTGQWRIVDLRPGTYTVIFSLSGFRTVRREAIDLAGSATLTIPAELGVGNLQETITVVAETPIVDVQSARRETVLQADVIQTLPATRSYGAILNTIPGLTVSGPVSAQTTPGMTFFTARGGPINEGRVMIDGMNTAAAFNGGGVSTLTYNTNDVDEIQVMISGGLGENETGGPHMNIVPRSGGNTFAGQAFMNTAGDWSRAENIDDYLRSVGIERGPALITSWDASGSYGGPIARDRVWFYGTIRNYGNARVVEGANTGNLFAADPNSWAYAPDTTLEEVRDVEGRDIFAGRATAQAGRHRFSFSQEYQFRCDGTTRTPQADGCRRPEGNWIGLGSSRTSPEADAGYFPLPYHVTQATWTMPASNRLLFEAGFSRLSYVPGFGQAPSDGIFDMIPVTEQRAIDGHRANFTFRAIDDYRKNRANPNNFRASASYVTGAHNMKVGYQGAYQISDESSITNKTLMEYRFRNRVPNRFTVNLPDWFEANRTVQHSLYAQDQWTVNRLTLQGAIRYDHAYSWSPAEHNGTTTVSRFNPNPITFDRTVSVRGYNDITPRMSAAYDVFGNGRTAIKVNLGKYLDAATNDGNYTVNSPANRIQRDMDRSWEDGNGNFVVDCDILDLSRQDNRARGGDLCAAPVGNDLNFANVQDGLTQVNPDILGGWGVRSNDWQFGVAVQQEILPRVSIDVGYNRRWWGNFFVVDNQARGPEDYEEWSFAVPVDPRLPGGGGYTITQLTVTPEAGRLPARNYVTFETDYGNARTNYWHGVDVTVNARMRNGLVVQGGTTTGREVDDRCDTFIHIDGVSSAFSPLARRLQTGGPDMRDCRVVEPVQTTFRGLASYTIPKVDVLVSASMRSLPGPELGAIFNVPNTVVRESLGRLPSGGTTRGTTEVDLTRDGEMYSEERMTQVDMRFAKIFRFAGTRADFGVDLYNLFNTNTTVSYEDQFGVDGSDWLIPDRIVQPRFVRLNLTLNF